MIRRLINKLRRRAGNQKSSWQFYSENGNIKEGKNCKIGNLEITVYGANTNQVNIAVGDDCFLEGKIIIYSNNAQVTIGNRVFIGPDTTLFCYEDLLIGDDVMISWGCTLITTNAHSLSSEDRIQDVVDWKKGWQFKDWSKVESKQITIEKKCWIGFNSIIVKGVTLAEGTVVASGSVVTKSSAPFSMIGGNPAVFIKSTT